MGVSTHFYDLFHLDTQQTEATVATGSASSLYSFKERKKNCQQADSRDLPFPSDWYNSQSSVTPLPSRPSFQTQQPSKQSLSIYLSLPSCTLPTQFLSCLLPYSSASSLCPLSPDRLLGLYIFRLWLSHCNCHFASKCKCLSNNWRKKEGQKKLHLSVPLVNL